MFLQNTVALNVKNKEDKNADDEKGSLTTSLDEELESLDSPRALTWSASVMNKPITLNVGGIKYTTTKATLSTTQDTFLYKMFIEKKFKVEPLDDGSYFIDRDGLHFRFILNFLRDGFVNIGNESIVSELLQEAMFYQIQPLINHLEMMVKTTHVNRVQSNIFNKNHIQKLSQYFKVNRWEQISYPLCGDLVEENTLFWESFVSTVCDGKQVGETMFVFRVIMKDDLDDDYPPSSIFGIYKGASDTYIFYSQSENGSLAINGLKSCTNSTEQNDDEFEVGHVKCDVDLPDEEWKLTYEYMHGVLTLSHVFASEESDDETESIEFNIDSMDMFRCFRQR